MSTPEDRLEARLRAIATEADPPPELVLESARAAFAMRDLDAELASLIADSALDEAGVLTRSVVADVRMLSFECGTVSVELDVDADPLTRSLRLRGLAVGAVGDVVVVRSDGRTAVPLDEDGRFGLGDVAPGPVRLELTTPDGRRVTTSWVSV
jgi:hypothetical protein